MISAKHFTQAAAARGYRFYTGVPCSFLKPFINTVIDDPDLTYVGAANEGDAVAIAAGATVAGTGSVVMFQNSGFGNTVNPLTSLNAISEIPSLIITTWRAEPGGAHDEPQHLLMGQITPGLFELMGIPWEIFPESEADIVPALERATETMARTQRPYGFIMRKDTCESAKLKSVGQPREIPAPIAPAAWDRNHLPTRREILGAVQAAAQGKLPSRDVLVATTGFTGRALYALEDRDNQFYMVGSMGCASAFGLGIALAQPKSRVIVLDGDGAALMRLGALATVGYERPKNLVHILLDNEVHDSTGGQSTVTHSVDLAQVARACGYPRVLRTTQAAEITAILQAPVEELTFIHVKTAPGEASDLPRPTVTPRQVSQRFAAYLKSLSRPA